MGFNVFRLLAIFMLLIALMDLPYEYYTFLRFVVCPVSTYGALVANRSNKSFWTCSLAICAVLFNPLLRVHCERNTWCFLNLLAALLILISMFVLSSTSQKRLSESNS